MSTRFIVAAAVGIAVAFIPGGQAYAFQAFALTYGVTGFLDPNTRVLGPKLNDLKAPQASFGAPIPYLEGTPRLAGNFIYASEKREIETTVSQGKGGPGVDSTTWTYEIDCLIELAINECVAIRRIWSNGKLVWTHAADATAASIAASEETNSWRDIRFYSGDAAQLPDPTYEAAVGVGNAPAYRGRTTVFIEGLNLGGSGQLPILTFEVIHNGTTSIRPPRVLLQSDYKEGTGADDAYYNLAPIVYGTPIYVVSDPPGSGSLSTNDCGWGEVAYVEYSHASIFNHDTTQVISLQARSSWGELADTSNAIITYDIAATRYWRVSWYGTTGGLIGYDSTITVPGVQVFAVNPLAVDVSILLIIGTGNPCNVRLYIDGALVMNISETNNLAIGTGSILVGSTGNNDFGSNQQYNITNVRVERGEAEIPGAELLPPDGPVTVITPTADLLSDVVSRLCLRTGQLEAADIDVTELASDVVRSMAISQVATTRVTLETLMVAYLFEAVEGEKLRFVKRGMAPLMTIPYDDLGASEDGNAEPFPKRRVNDIEIAARVSVKFANVDNDHQDGLEAADRLITESTAESVVEVPIGFTPGEAKRLADANTLDLAVSLQQAGPLLVPRKYAALEPTDVILVVAADGSTFRLRIVRTTIGGGISSLDVVLDDANAIDSAAATSGGYTSSVLVRSIVQTNAVLLDIPALRDADAMDLGFYVAAKPNISGVWPGYELDESLDNITYSKVYDSASRAIHGVATSTLGNFTGGNVFDEVNSVTVDVGFGTLSSASRNTLLTTSTNAMVIGSEIVQFRSASLLAPGSYLLSGFLRGRRGTEWAMAGHVPLEKAVLLEVGGLRRVDDELLDLDVEKYWKAVTHGKSRASVPAQTFANTGVNMKPFAPVDLRIEGTDVTWHRRSRLASTFLSTVEVPLGETTESYDVEVLDSGDVVLSTTTVSTPVFDISSPPGGADKVRVYQRSQTVGRGYPATLEL